MTSSSSTVLDPTEYTVAWIAPLAIEAQAALGMLDVRHQGQFPFDRDDDCVYLAGEICGHRVVIATSAAGEKHRKGFAGALASNVKKLFTNLRFGLLVGVATGLPNLSRLPPRDIRLGDVLVGFAEGNSAGPIAYDLRKETGLGFQPLHYGHALATTEPIVRSAIGSIKIDAPNDALVLLPFYETFRDKEHTSGNFEDPGQHRDVLYDDSVDAAQPIERIPRLPSKRTRIWYGPIGSGDKLLKNAQKRNELRDRYGVIGLEMEAAGVMKRIPVGVIRGVCSYGDHNESEEWQAYAAAMAASYAKAVLDKIQSANIGMSIISRSDGFGQNLQTDDSNDAFTTTLLSQIQRLDVDTMELLCFLSCIRPNAIPQSMLPKPKSQKTKLAVTRLCDSSVLRRRNASDTFDMHKLFYAAIQSQMEEQHQTQQAISVALSHLAKVFPEDYSNRGLCMAYLFHALHLLGISDKHEMKERYELFNRVGNCLREEGRLEDAIDCHKKAYQWAIGPQNQDDRRRYAYQHDLAVTYRKSGRIKDAISLLKSVVEFNFRMLAEDSPDRLYSEDELAIAFFEDKRPTDAIDLLESIIETRSRMLPEDNLERLDSQYRLAEAYLEDGQVRAAIPQLEATVNILTKVTGPELPQCLRSQRLLAKAYHHDGQLKKEIELLEPLVEVEKEIHETGHPERLALEYELALAYMSDQRNDEATKLFESLVTRCTPSHKRAWKTTRISIPDMVNNLGSLYESQGQLDQAQKMFSKALQGYELAQGPDHPSTLVGLRNLANVLAKQGNSSQAQELYQRALGSYRHNLDPLHATTVTAADRLATLLHSQGKTAEEKQTKTSIWTSSYIETLHTHGSTIESSSIPSKPSDQTSVSEGHIVQAASTRPTTVSNNIPAGFLLGPQKPSGDSDIESLTSDKDEIQSQDSHHTTPREARSKRLLGEALVEEQQFRELCDEALRKMDGNRFAENVRRLLKLFYKELSFEAQSGPQKATAGLLRSPGGRYKIGQHVYALLQQDPEAPINTDPEEKQSIESWFKMTYPSTRQEDEEEWFVSAAGPEEMDGTSDLESDNDSVGGSESDLQEPFPAISNLSSFLRESKAFKVLLEHFTSLFVPFELQELAQSIPRDRIEFSYEQDFSVMNQFKLWMEKQTCSSWNWWPFTQPKRVLQEDEVRILWRCNCGKTSWDEISVNQARWMKKLQALSDSTAPSPCWCPIKEGSSGIALENLSQLQSLSGATTSNSPQAVDDAQKSPNRAPVPSATAGKLTPSQLKPNRSEISSMESEMMEQGRHGSIEQHWVLFGVQGPRPTRIPGEVTVETSTTDYHFFKSLKAEYAKHRGRIRLWFSLWQLEYFEFAEFQRLTPKRMVLERSGLPPQPGEYDYIRCHTGNDLQIQPVSRHVFKSFLESCSDPCRLSWFFPHDCDTFKGGNSNLKRIPKRNRSFINDETTEIWGLGTMYHLSCVHVITYHLIMVGGPMAFFAWWMIKFPGDLQNASVPVTIALGFLSLFWGILISFKDVS